MKGKIIRILADKSFGFIRGEDRVEYFFHASALKNFMFSQAQIGDPVTFENTEGQKGPRAEDIYLE